MGFLTDTKPVVTKNEWDIVKNRLANERGWKMKKIAVAEKMVRPYLDNKENYGDPVGISQQEVKELDEEFKEGDSEHVFSTDLSESDIDVLEGYLKDALVTKK